MADKKEQKITTHFPADYQSFQLDLLFNLKLQAKQNHELMFYDLEHIYIEHKVKLSSPMIVFLLYHLSLPVTNVYCKTAIKLLSKVILHDLISNNIWTGCCIPLILFFVSNNSKCDLTQLLNSILMLVYRSPKILDWKQMAVSASTKDTLQLIFIGKTKTWKAKSNLILCDLGVLQFFNYLLDNYIEEF